MAGCDLVFLCLPDAPAVEEVLFGADGLAARCAPAAAWWTPAPSHRRRRAPSAQRLAERGVSFLDAPVTGGQQGAEAGTLGTMVGGPLEVLEACRDVMGAFCKTITHVGALGAGQTVKACNQVAVSTARCSAWPMPCCWRARKAST
jgi:2-hydroxy-3-oxopropionate reductase